jgi:glycosyltransferase involved in cell wall biosynthesis
MSIGSATTALSGITVIVPTFKRTADLDRCLAALERQTVQPAELLITFRDEDVETQAYLARRDRPCLAAKIILCEQPGVVYALNRALDEVRGEYFAFLDDDAVPREDWLARIVAHFEANPQLAGVGGKDYVFTGGRWLEGAEPVVGIVTWYGAAIGNHHIGAGPPRYVQVLKGVNMAFRTAAFGDLRLDRRLRGKGAQVGWELHLSLTLIARGAKLLYDPEVLVEHFAGVRPIEEDRHLFHPSSHSDEIFNRTLILLEYLGTQPWGWARQLAFLAYIGVRGTRKSPGLLLLLYGLLTGYPNTWRRFKVSFAAYRDAILALRQNSSARHRA